jgi:hypothetical protein
MSPRQRSGAAGAPKTDDELLALYRPFLYYDSLESYRADSAAVLPEQFFDGGQGWSYSNSLKRKSGAVLASARPAPGQQKLDLAFLGGAMYRDGVAVRKDDLIDAFGRDYVADAGRMHAQQGYANRCYGYVAREADGTRWLQYWFFYYYNDKSFARIGLHEGDWEMIQLRLGANDAPNVVTFAQHNTAEAFRYEELITRNVGEARAPVVYVGRGSHASFHRPGRHEVIPFSPDHADGKGEKRRPALDVISLQTGWVAWPGKWGSSGTSPGGPAKHEQWSDPGGFHGEVAGPAVRGRAPARAARAPAGPPPPEPPTPTLTVRRDRDRAVISYRFPARLAAGTAPSDIVISVDGLDDDLPPATYTFKVRDRTGTVTHPFPLADGRYVVRAVAMRGEEAASEAASRPVPKR